MLKLNCIFLYFLSHLKFTKLLKEIITFVNCQQCTVFIETSLKVTVSTIYTYFRFAIIYWSVGAIVIAYLKTQLLLLYQEEMDIA